MHESNISDPGNEFQIKCYVGSQESYNIPYYGSRLAYSIIIQLELSIAKLQPFFMFNRFAFLQLLYLFEMKPIKSSDYIKQPVSCALYHHNVKYLREHHSS